MITNNSAKHEPGASTLSLRVYYQIKNEILTCKMQPGQMVFETDLIQKYGVSKTPVREALKLLTQDRLIQSIPGTCYIVTPITVKDVNNIWEMRAILEEATAIRAANRITEPQLAHLESLVGEIFPLHSQDDLIKWYSQNHQFHLALAEISENDRLVAALQANLDEATRFLLLDPQMPPDTKDWVSHHQLIVNALKQHDGVLATAITLEDMQIARPRIEKLSYSGTF